MCGTEVVGPPGAALSVTGAPVLIRVGDPATGCAGDRLAGHVVLSANQAVTFGANIAYFDATIDNNGPGGTVVQANTVSGTLARAPATPLRPPTPACPTRPLPRRASAEGCERRPSQARPVSPWYGPADIRRYLWGV
jgi:hypothetical protein